MKVKMFVNNNANPGELEQEINSWLCGSAAKVIDIKQSYTCDVKTCYTLVSVWYEDGEEGRAC